MHIFVNVNFFDDPTKTERGFQFDISELIESPDLMSYFDQILYDSVFSCRFNDCFTLEMIFVYTCQTACFRSKYLYSVTGRLINRQTHRISPEVGPR